MSAFDFGIHSLTSNKAAMYLSDESSIERLRRDVSLIIARKKQMMEKDAF